MNSAVDGKQKVVITFIPPDSEFELTKKSKCFSDDHKQNMKLNKELAKAAEEAEFEAKAVMAIDQTLTLQMSPNSAGDYALSRKSQTLDDIHQQNIEEQKNLMHEIEKLKKNSMMQEARESVQEEAFMSELSRIEEEHEKRT